jgi:hypothetical protein
LLSLFVTPAEFLHVKPGKGAAFVRTKLKNLLSNGNQEKTFRGGETVNLAEVSRREVQFTYPDGDQVSEARPLVGCDKRHAAVACSCCPDCLGRHLHGVLYLTDCG